MRVCGASFTGDGGLFWKRTIFSVSSLILSSFSLFCWMMVARSSFFGQIRCADKVVDFDALVDPDRDAVDLDWEDFELFDDFDLDLLAFDNLELDKAELSETDFESTDFDPADRLE